MAARPLQDPMNTSKKAAALYSRLLQEVRPVARTQVPASVTDRWHWPITRYFKPSVYTGSFEGLTQNKCTTTNLFPSEKYGPFVQCIDPMYYVPGKHGLPLLPIFGHTAARIIVPALIVTLPNAYFLSKSTSVDSMIAAQSFVGFGLILWGTAGVHQGLLGHGISAALATACLLNGIDKMHQMEDSPSPLSEPVMQFTPLIVGVLTAALMAVLLKFAPSSAADALRNGPNGQQSIAKLRKVNWV